MFLRTDNPVHDFWAYSMAQEEWLENRPTCDECGQHIQDEQYFDIEGKKYCESCLNYYKKWIDSEVMANDCY